MNHYVFASPDILEKCTFDSIEALDDVCEDFYSVVLSGSQQLELLLKLWGIEGYQKVELPESEDFESVIDISANKFPELSKDGFDDFYERWILESGRDSNMDEYGQLTFILGQANIWNQRPYKVVLSERS
ncbi:MAG: hypothetical protein KJ856_21385 [Gammaproteobacteria bacterium]|uniref:Uncharacterized protein n=1 Tax=viral metagenome TaxID=1070528 RepID=A0A6H1ZR56_9ZZZZ|nr:hypothetical protein [Gammaproteobacteria bacterium]MBU1479282.1 hypothetical protein [Gammaproteobacteria bacterium]MBU2002283.1 hypothetical protein [Gammaproteobacteria bacterium]MBU2132156.1 hypothetical protein [Gammaproteobacteria bacterium]MBU2189537.1 hypothetical protein [Gammaproteobacteria bacterium]